MRRKDEAPNVKLAQEIVAKGDRDAVKQLVAGLMGRDKNIQGDCIKVLYEIGGRDPSLISQYSGEFVSLLDSQNNRLVGGQ